MGQASTVKLPTSFSWASPVMQGTLNPLAGIEAKDQRVLGLEIMF